MMLNDLNVVAEVTSIRKHLNYGDYTINIRSKTIEGPFVIRILVDNSHDLVYLRGDSQNGVLPIGKYLQFGQMENGKFLPYCDTPMSQQADNYQIVAESDTDGEPITFRKYIENLAEYWISSSPNPEHVQKVVLYKYGNVFDNDNYVYWVPLVTEKYRNDVKIVVRIPFIRYREDPVGFAPVPIFNR